jgi:hypothetical protein
MKKRLPANLEKFRVTNDPEINAMYVNQTFGSIEGFFRIPVFHTDLAVICGCGEGWDHVSISHPERCPTWDEMCFIKNLFFMPEETVIQFHPPQSQYINKCKTVLHLWRPWNDQIELPPKWMLE